MQIVKAMINFAEGEDPDAPIEGLAGALTATTEDLAEGVAAFRAKRAPTFTADEEVGMMHGLPRLERASVMAGLVWGLFCQ